MKCIKVADLLNGGIQLLELATGYIYYYNKTTQRFISVNDLNNYQDYIVSNITKYMTDITIFIKKFE